jgi:signal transduction histidine kinase
MSISMIFSLGFYQVSVNELERGIRHQPGSPISQIIRTRNAELLNQLVDEQEDAVVIARSRLQANLILINIFILLGGGMLSYVLARRTLKPIEEMHEAQSRFTADASHELRTPIAAMRLENELALDDDSLTIKDARELLKSNIEELDKLTKLSEGLLQLAQLDNDSIETQSIKVRSIVEQAVERMASESKARKQTIVNKKIDGGTISVNEVAAVEALVTILDNAVKYSPDKTEIYVATKRSKTALEISVKDSGIGIPEDAQAHIFDRFYRADDSRNKETAEGYGIGLSIAKSVVESHGGTISVESVQGSGSTFTLSFPVK